MNSDFFIKPEKFEDENGVKFVALQFEYKKKENLLKNVLITGAEIAVEVFFVAYLWKLNFHLAWCLIVSAMGIVSFFSFCKNVRSYIWELPRLQRRRLQLLLYLAVGIITYFTFIHDFSEALKHNSKEWVIYFGVAAYGYHLAVSSVIRMRGNYDSTLGWIVGGWLLVVSGSMQVAYSVNNHYYLSANISFMVMLYFGFREIGTALQTFQETVEMDPSVFYCIFEMIVGAIVFTLGCLDIIFTKKPIMLLVSLVAAGIGIAMLRKSIIELYDLVPQPVFQRYCLRVLGPLVNLCGVFLAAYVDYNIGWWSFLLMPLLSAGIYFTYQGFRESASVVLIFGGQETAILYFRFSRD